MLNFIRMLWVVVAMVLVMAVTAFGATTIGQVAPPDNVGVAALTAFLQGTVFPVITALFMGLVAVCLRKLGEKFHIDALSQQNNILERLALQGITLAEERAAQLVGSKSALTGNQKLDVAVSHVLTFMPKISPTQAGALVESMLAQISGVGATKDAAFAPGPGSAVAVSPLVA